MAEANISVTQAQFICSICLDLLKNPVTIPCGHSYCMNCITDYWNYLLKLYSCPQCRQTFNPRPVLNKNVVMAEMVENLKTLSCAGPGDVVCDVCTGKKYKAVKSCLVCLESYCQTHFERHEEFHSGRRHKVTDATGRLKQMICSKHDKQLEIYCRTDQCCICYLCTMDEHRNHDTVAAVVERTEKQKQLEDTQRKFQQTIQDRQKNLQELKETHGRSTQTAVESSQRIYVEPMYATEIRPVIRDRENTGGLLVQLEQEIEDLKTTEAELKQLSITNDHIYFLQCFQSLVSPLETLDGPINNSSFPSSDVRKSVSELKEKLERLGIEKKLSDRVEATPSPSQRSQHPLPSLQPPPLPPLQLPPRPLPSLPTRLPTPSLQSPPGPPQRSQHSPPPLPSLPPPPSPPPPLRLQHPPTPPQSLQSPPTPFRSQYPLPPPSALRSQQLLPPIPPSLRSQQPPTPPPKPLRLQFPVSPPLRSQNSVESPPPPLPPPLRSQNSLQSPPPLPPPLRSQNSVESPPPLPPLLRSQNSVESPPPLPPLLRSQNSVESPPPLPPLLRSQNSVESPPPLPLRSQTSPPPLPPSLRSHR